MLLHFKGLSNTAAVVHNTAAKRRVTSCGDGTNSMVIPHSAGTLTIIG